MSATIVPFTRPVIDMPVASRTLAEAGLSFDLVLQLVLKTLHFYGELTGADLGRRLGLQHSVLEPVLAHLKQTHLVAISGGGLLGGPSFHYHITDSGRERALRCRRPRSPLH